MPIFAKGDRLVEIDDGQKSGLLTSGQRFGKTCVVLDAYCASSGEALANFSWGNYKLQFDGREGWQTLGWDYVEKNFRKIDKAIENALCR